MRPTMTVQQGRKFPPDVKTITVGGVHTVTAKRYALVRCIS